MSELIRKSHNVSVLLYHFVCPAKYRIVVFSEEVDTTLKDICLEISKRYEIHFVEIGTDQDHVHFYFSQHPNTAPQRLLPSLKALLPRRFSNNTQKSRRSCGAVSSGQMVILSGVWENMEMSK